MCSLNSTTSSDGTNRCFSFSVPLALSSSDTVRVQLYATTDSGGSYSLAAGLAGTTFWGLRYNL